MARTLNMVQLIGRLGADPEAHVTATGSQFTTFSLATNRQWNGADGVLNSETDWHRIVAWGALGETCVAHLRKGRLVYIEGRLSTRSWEADGQKHQRTEIVASDMIILDQKSQEESQPKQSRELVGAGVGKQRGAHPSPDEETDDDLLALPF